MNPYAKLYLVVMFLNVIALVFHIANGAIFMVFFTLFWFLLAFFCFMATVGKGESRK